MDNIKYKQQSFIILVRYYGPTNTKGSRIAFISKRLKKKITFSWDYFIVSCLGYQARAILNKKSIDIVAWSEFDKEYIIMIPWSDGLKLFNCQE